MSEEQEYMTLDEAAQAVGLKRPSLYYYLNALKIKKYRFNLNRHTYISKADVEHIRGIKEKPWTAGTKEEVKEAA